MTEFEHEAQEALGPEGALFEVWDAMAVDDGFEDRVMRALEERGEAEARADEDTDPSDAEGVSRWWRSAAAILVAAGVGGAGVIAAIHDDEPVSEARESVAAESGEAVEETPCDAEPCDSPTLKRPLPAYLERDIHRYLSSYGRHYGPAFSFSGVVLVARGDEVIEIPMGQMGLGVPEEMRGDAIFRIGSLTQPLVAMTFARFVESGRLELDQSIESCGVDVPRAWSAVTLRQLASHRSGIPNYTDSPIYQMRRRDVHDALELWNYVGGEGLEFEPGSDYEPSNTNYVLLGACLAKKAETSLDEVLAQELFVPAEMHGARMGLGPAKQSAHGMTFDEDERLRPSFRVAPSALAGAGGVSASAHDLLAFHRALRDETLLPREAQEDFYKLTHSSGGGAGYAMGWTASLVEGDYELGHPGGLDGFNAQFTRRLHDDTFVAVLMNHDSVDARAVAAGVLALVDGESPELPNEKMEVALDPKRVPVVVGRYRLSDKSRKHYQRFVDTEALAQMDEVTIEFDQGRLWMAVPGHGRKWMHREGGERYFFKDLQGTSAVFGLASGPGPDRASFLSLRSGPLEFMLLRDD